jgi:putative colanic acid biosynthesis glycosyltransferase
MKVALINSQLNGSTGAVVLGLSSALKEKGAEACLITSHSPSELYPTFETNGPIVARLFSKMDIRLNGNDGFTNCLRTKKALRFLDQEKPDIIHLHNVHEHYIDVALVIDYAKRKGIPVLWTLHDAWLLSGRCCSFEAHHCEKWKSGCGHCPYKKNYPATLLDSSAHYWALKREVASGVILVSPSHWLADLLSSSGYPNPKVIPNGVDTAVFYPQKPLESVLEAAQGRRVVLAASSSWNKEKGLEDLQRLAQELDPQHSLLAVAGLSEAIPGVFSLPLIHDPLTMARFYSSGDVFVNFTQEDNLPSVNIESIACGTPVVTYQTGGASEMIQEGVNGFSVPKGDFALAKSRVLSLLGKPFAKETVSQSEPLFTKKAFAASYLALYDDLLRR